MNVHILCAACKNARCSFWSDQNSDHRSYLLLHHHLFFQGIHSAVCFPIKIFSNFVSSRFYSSLAHTLMRRIVPPTILGLLPRFPYKKIKVGIRIRLILQCKMPPLLFKGKKTIFYHNFFEESSIFPLFL